MPSLITALAYAIGGVLVDVATALAGRLMIGFGVAIATYSGLDATLGWLKSSAITNLSALPVNVIGLLGLMKVGVMLSIISSAYVARLTLAGLTSGSIKKWVHK